MVRLSIIRVPEWWGFSRAETQHVVRIDTSLCGNKDTTQVTKYSSKLICSVTSNKLRHIKHDPFLIPGLHIKMLIASHSCPTSVTYKVCVCVGSSGEKETVKLQFLLQFVPGSVPPTCPPVTFRFWVEWQKHTNVTSTQSGAKVSRDGKIYSHKITSENILIKTSQSPIKRPKVKFSCNQKHRTTTQWLCE